VVVANTGLTGGVKSFSGTGPARLITDLFPYQSGYEVWVGGCPDSDPQGTTGPPSNAPLYPGATRLFVPVDPGQTTTATVPLKLVDIEVVDRFGNQVSNAGVRATNSCRSVNSRDIGSTALVPPPILRVGLPFGGWTFRSAPGTQSAVLDPMTPNPQRVVINR
jgi:hypothetical protein